MDLPKELERRPLRHSMEVRHASFACEEFISLLRKHNIALVVADTAGKWPFMEDITSDFTYVRLHGDEVLYASGYTEKSLERWAEKNHGVESGKKHAGCANSVAKTQSSCIRM